MRRMVNLSRSIFSKRHNFIPLFPLAKISLLIALYLVTGDRSIFVFSISFISVSFFIRLVSGNPFALTKKFIGAPECIGSYRTFCVIVAAVSFATYFVPGVFSSGLALTLLITASKLIEATLASILFEMSMNKDRRIRYFGYYFGGLAAMFICVTYLIDVVSAIILDVVLMALAVALLKNFLTGGWTFPRRLKKILANNYEISVTVFPVSIFVIWYGSDMSLSAADQELLGYLALAFSAAGFLNRPISLWASYLGAISYKMLSSVSHYISLTALLLVAVYFEYPMPFFEVVLAAMFIVCIAVQNFVRINLFSNSDVSLLSIHILETVVILLGMVSGASILLAAALLLLTRTSRLIYISRHKALALTNLA